MTVFGQAANTGTLTLDRTQFLALVRQWSSHSQVAMQTLTSRAKQVSQPAGTEKRTCVREGTGRPDMHLTWGNTCM